jgi:RNase P subunit RPR2
MAEQKNSHGSHSKNEIGNFSAPLLQVLWDKHPMVARKLSMAALQLQSATSIEEYQQIGILVRDAWIEFAQKLFSVTFVPKGVEIPSASDAKKILEHVLAQWPSRPEQLIRVSGALIDLANEVQHKRTVDEHSAKWCLLVTLLVMALMLDLDSQYHKLAGRKYYRCPQCGSLNLSYKKDQEVDFDGPGQEYEIWGCHDCDWEHFVYLF